MYVWFVILVCLLFLHKSAELYLNSLVHLLCGRGSFLQKKTHVVEVCAEQKWYALVFESGNQDFSF